VSGAGHGAVASAYAGGGGFRVKVCGLTDARGIDAVARAGVDRVGFVFAESPREVTPRQASALSRELPAAIERVAVMRRATQAAVDALFEHFVPDCLQADAASLVGLDLPAGLRVLPVVRDGEAVEVRAMPALLYEAPVSGRGVVADWTAAARIARAAALTLAGGLTPENVAAAIARVRPAGVDVSSGVESAPGVKDPELINRFVTAARDAVRRHADEKPALAGEE
jgi:phosphoribosylanthranilate isomerase